VPCACCEGCYARGRRITWLRRAVWVYLIGIVAVGAWGVIDGRMLSGAWPLLWFALFIPIFIYMPLVCFYPMMRLLALGLKKSLRHLSAIPWTMLTLPFVLPWRPER
jgi:hypothetical protein